MLWITIPALECWDESKNEFVYYKEQTIQLEHSLVSIAKWESRWHKAFLKKDQKTNDEILDYIRCMTITQNVDPSVYMRLTELNYKQIQDYIDSPMTATYIPKDENSKGSSEIPTAELIYYWMISFNIPFECQKWHLNRLLALINVCNIKNRPPKKMSKRDLLSRNARINAANRKRFNSKG